MVAFTAGAVLTAANLNTAFNALTFRAVTGTSDTFVLADNGGAVSYSNASPITATVPPFSSVAYANGTTIELLNLGAGVVTVTAGVGVTLNGSSAAIAQNAGGTLIKTATNTWYFLPSSTGSGMDLITPTSVAGSGVSFSGGQITFTTATSISANGVFTSAYDNYLMVLLTTASAAASQLILARLRLSGTDAVTNFKTQRLFYSTGATVQVNPSGTDDWTVSAADSTNPTSLAVLTIASPAIARATAMKGEFQNVSSGGDLIGNVITGIHTTATAYDGITVLGESGSITGTLRIYGLRNS